MREPCNVCQQRVVRVVDLAEFLNKEVEVLLQQLEIYRQAGLALPFEAANAQLNAYEKVIWFLENGDINVKS